MNLKLCHVNLDETGGFIFYEEISTRRIWTIPSFLKAVTKLREHPLAMSPQIMDVFNLFHGQFTQKWTKQQKWTANGWSRSYVTVFTGLHPASEEIVAIFRGAYIEIRRFCLGISEIKVKLGEKRPLLPLILAKRDENKRKMTRIPRKFVFRKVGEIHWDNGKRE